MSDPLPYVSELQRGMMPIETIEHFGGDFGVTVIYQQSEEYGHVSVEFFAYEITGRSADANGEYVVAEYQKADASSSEDHVLDPRLAENYFRGHVKWDGCSHFYFGETDNSGYLHLCGIENIKKLALAVETVYERCGELMQTRPDCNLLEGEFRCAP